MLDPRQVEAALDPDKIGQIGGMHGVPKRATILWEDMELIHAAARAWLASQSVTDAEVEAAAKVLWVQRGGLGPEFWWNEAMDGKRDSWRNAARVALEAARSVRQETP